MGINESVDVHGPKLRPYKYQEYPRALYGAEGKVKLVKNDDQRKAALANGWRLEAPVPPSAEDLDAVEAEKELKKATTKKS